MTTLEEHLVKDLKRKGGPHFSQEKWGVFYRFQQLNLGLYLSPTTNFAQFYSLPTLDQGSV